MTDVADGTPATADPQAPPASLTAISIKVRRRSGEKPTVAFSPTTKSGDLTRHLEREAAAAAVVPSSPAPADTWPEAPRQSPEPLAEAVAEMRSEMAMLEAIEAPSPASSDAAPAELAPVEPEANIHSTPAPEPVAEVVRDAEPDLPSRRPAPPVSATPPALSIVPTEPSAIRPPPVAAPAPVQIAPHPVAHAPDFTDIAGYWRSLCSHDRSYPPSSAVDRDLVSKRWPGTLMISFARAPGIRDPSIGGVTRLGTASTAMQEAIDSGSYAIEWMIEVGRAALAASAPLEELQRLPTRAGTIAFRLLALPLGAQHADPDSVLCHLAPAAAAPRFGKRRNWLAA